MLNDEQVKVLESGGVAVLPTGSVYGIMASAHHQEAVDRVYNLKGRDPSKPSIILVADADDLKQFDVLEDDIDKARDYWPEMTSVIVPVPESVAEFLHRGTRSLAFRVPPSEGLRRVLELTGPLIAPSANPESEPPATTINEAKGYFGDKVDFYIDGGVCDEKPSKLIRINDDGVETLRE
ncbi:MAG: L-threonylcarbamoyladenylate synthase [Candidatus Saccharimonadales bacterium]|nr:L-threonylcarbamoyladenylate synthase [Candidatus Saccharimonadales bacterium]